MQARDFAWNPDKTKRFAVHVYVGNNAYVYSINAETIETAIARAIELTVTASNAVQRINAYELKVIDD